MTKFGSNHEEGRFSDIDSRSDALWIGYKALLHLTFFGFCAATIYVLATVKSSPSEQSEWVSIFLMWIVVGILILLASALTFGLSQYIQTILIFKIGREWTIKSLIANIATIVLCAALSALSWDYLTPSYRYFTDTDPPWVHGLTLHRWRFAVPFQFVLASYTSWLMRRHFAIQVNDSPAP
jgi:hypothetical protein